MEDNNLQKNIEKKKWLKLRNSNFNKTSYFDSPLNNSLNGNVRKSPMIKSKKTSNTVIVSKRTPSTTTLGKKTANNQIIL